MKSRFKDYFAGLERLKLDHFPLYYSPNCRTEAEILGEVTSKAYSYLQGFFRDRPEIILLVLNEADWKKREPNQPYGDPFVPDVRVHYGVKPPLSWKEMFTLLSSRAPINLKRKLVSVSVYKNNIEKAIDGIFTFDFFVPTVVHEIAHPFLGLNLVLPQPVEFRYAFKMDAFWLAEFLPQYAMYSFLQAHNKSLCEKWLLLMKSAFEGGKAIVKYSRLAEMGRKYSEMIDSCIENIFWYQAKLFTMAADLYSHHGESFLTKAIDSLRLSQELLIDRVAQTCKNFETWLQSWK